MVWLVCKVNGRARTIAFPLRGRQKKLRVVLKMYFQMWFSIPAYCNSLRYGKLSQCLHVLLLWWSGYAVTALRLLKPAVRECISPRINCRLYLASGRRLSYTLSVERVVDWKYAKRNQFGKFFATCWLRHAHVWKDTRLSGFPYCKRRKAGLGTRLAQPVFTGILRHPGEWLDHNFVK